MRNGSMPYYFFLNGKKSVKYICQYSEFNHRLTYDISVYSFAEIATRDLPRGGNY